MHVVEVSHAKAVIRIKDGCLNVSSNGITLGSVPLAEVSARKRPRSDASCHRAAVCPDVGSLRESNRNTGGAA